MYSCHYVHCTSGESHSICEDEKGLPLNQTNIGRTATKTKQKNLSERRDGEHKDFLERVDTVMNWRELRVKA